MSAWVERHGPGWRVRARVSGRLRTIGTYPTREEAVLVQAAYERRAATERVRDGLTLADFRETLLASRKARGVRSVKQDGSRWKEYVQADPIGAITLRGLRRSDVVAWRDRLMDRGLSMSTVRLSLHLLRAALSDALDRELVASNVASDVRVPRTATTTMEEDLAGVLTPAEQRRLLEAVPHDHRATVAFALLTGLRWSELAHLRWEDVRADALVVRRSAGGKATKSGKPRVVPLLGATRSVLAELPRTGALVIGGRRPRRLAIANPA